MATGQRSSANEMPELIKRVDELYRLKCVKQSLLNVELVDIYIIKLKIEVLESLIWKENFQPKGNGKWFTVQGL